MKTIQKLLAALLAVICLFSVSACANKAISESDMEDGEDVSVTYGKVTVANLSGKDAVQLYYKRSGTDQWSENILTQDYFHKDMGLEITYPMGAKSTYDIRLIFEDGTYRDFINLDLEKDAAKGRIVYLGEAPEGAPKKTTVADTTK